MIKNTKPDAACKMVLVNIIFAINLFLKGL